MTLLPLAVSTPAPDVSGLLHTDSNPFLVDSHPLDGAKSDSG